MHHINGVKHNAIHLDPSSLSLTFLTKDDVIKLSVKEITVFDSFDFLGHPIPGGFYDPAFGPVSETSNPCETCSSNVFRCTGHYGHINLPLPIINPLFHRVIQKLIRMSCLVCFTLQMPALEKMMLHAESNLIQDGFMNSVDGLRQEVMDALPTVDNKRTQCVENTHILIAKDIMKIYIEKVHNRERSRTSHRTCNETNLNFLRMTHVDDAVKRMKLKEKCINCHELRPKVSVVKNRIKTSHKVLLNDDSAQGYRNEEMMIMPDDLREILHKLWDNDSELLKLMIPCLTSVPLDYPTDIFFLDVILVVPPLVRPVNHMGGQIYENAQTEVYKSLLRNCIILRNITQAVKDGDVSELPDSGKQVVRDMRGSTMVEKMHNAWVDLQNSGDHLMDRDLSKTTDSASCFGLRQIVEKKEGVIRMNMMGKRVNFACRTVITPDNNINLDEIGISEEFAKKLTYPVYVTPWNVEWIRKLIINGPDVHPGAVMIQGEDGYIRRLPADNLVMRQAIAKRLLTQDEKATKFLDGIKCIHRHLINGDMMLLNRQPTLHKPSIMAHKARILKGERTLRLHYANCKTYNADFDGDEMNAHYPQSELARAEASFIASVPNQYLVPKDGTPLSGLIQDHVVSGVKLSLRGNFFSREDYQQFVYSALSVQPGDIVLLPPAIIKPVPMWSGKQIISTVVINVVPRDRARINLDSHAKIRPQQWQSARARAWACGTAFQDPNTMSEAEVIFRGGELLCGVLDKNHYGATPFGLVHCVYELYGGEASCKLLSAFSKLFIAYLQRIGFTLGIEDILVKRKADAKRVEIINECRQIGENVQRSVLELPSDVPMEEVTAKFEEAYRANPKFRAQVDRKYKSALDVYTNRVNKTCLPGGLIKGFPDNNLQLMVQSGAKGSTVNTMQISCQLGQIELEGKRPPLMISGKSLPSFRAYDPSPRAGGFIDGRFMTGIQPQEYFFHCMAGREGLVDTAVKTSCSGYVQRCLIKHLEGVKVEYDSTVRNQDGNIIQFLYGEDGLDIPKSQFLNEKQFEFLVENKQAVVDNEMMRQHKRNAEAKMISRHLKKINKWKGRHGDPVLSKRCLSAFTYFSAANWDPASSKNRTISEGCGRSKSAVSLMRKWMRADDETKALYRAQSVRCPEPLNAAYWQHRVFGVLPEKLDGLLDEYVRQKPDANKNELRDLLCAKVMTTLCPPGEPVGLLAAQSIGEPSTQMTLNTFHFAGRGEMNVTLGIPRLREILMTASKNIKTPSMEIPFKSDLPKLEKQATKIKLKLTKCYLADVLKEVKIERKLELYPERRMLYTITFDFLPHRCYKKEFNARPKDIVETIQFKFLRAFFHKIKEASTYCSATIMWTDDKETKKAEEKLDEPDEPEASEPKSQNKSRMELGEAHESSDEEEVGDDADATVARRVARHQENQEYDDPDEEDIQPDEDEDAEDEAAEKPETAEDEDLRSMINELSNEKREILEKFKHMLDLEYDEKTYKNCKLTFWLPIAFSRLDMPSIIREVANNVVLSETPGVKRAFTFQNQAGETILKTDGINILEICKYGEILDLNRIYCNDIYGISQTYGIEAASRVIVKEVKDVFKMYGINVDTRHLSLVADYMTVDGTFSPFSRKGIESSGSPLQQMSYESSLAFLKTASLQGKCDNLTSPSSRLMLGQPVMAGTGSFEVMLDINKQLEMNKHSQPLSFTL